MKASGAAWEGKHEEAEEEAHTMVVVELDEASPQGRTGECFIPSSTFTSLSSCFSSTSVPMERSITSNNSSAVRPAAVLPGGGEAVVVRVELATPERGLLPSHVVVRLATVGVVASPGKVGERAECHGDDVRMAFCVKPDDAAASSPLLSSSLVVVLTGVVKEVEEMEEGSGVRPTIR